MTRWWIILLMVLGGRALAQPITVEVDGRALAEARPIRSGQRVLVPMRPLFEALGATLDLQGQRIIAKRGPDRVEVELGSDRARVNDREVRLDEPARVVSGRTLVPLRFVAEALGARVGYDGLASRVWVETALTPAPEPLGGPIGEEWTGAFTFEASRDLKRLRVGNQGGILKVMDPSNQREMVYRGIDDRNMAWIEPSQRASIFTALGVPSAALGRTCDSVMRSYSSLPRKEALAFLGAVGSHPGLDPALRQRLQSFVADKMTLEKDVVLRRQAVLALALMHGPLDSTVERVLSLYERSENLWETFPVQMFFEFHGGEIRSSQRYAAVRSRVALVNSLYTSNILGYLDSGSGPRRMTVGL
ncbi:copper amine oxidase N-terminal domain-containing protein [bacterium CPR1]|nr:copper amine oxidase N-terminal domain-containing protein [bacterium CPR1]